MCIGVIELHKRFLDAYTAFTGISILNLNFSKELKGKTAVIATVQDFQCSNFESCSSTQVLMMEDSPTLSHDVLSLQVSICKPLNNDKYEIRLLRIQPTKDPNADIDCTMESVSINNAPCYVALSYEWGKTGGNHSQGAQMGHLL